MCRAGHGEYERHGQFFFRGRAIRPYNLPIESLRMKIEAYQSSDRTVVVYHPILGWAPRPEHVSSDGLYSYDSRGARSAPYEAGESSEAEGLRIALFGDSFTLGSDVPFEESLGYLLEGNLSSPGLTSDVLNFGVGGCGMDQALLRHRRQGEGVSPDVVVFGFQAENVKRNMNLIRPLYFPNTTLTFAKQRFILCGDQLDLINVPVLPVDRVVETMMNLDQWVLAPFEFFYNRENFEEKLWRASKLLAVSVDVFREVVSRESFYDLDGEPAKIALKLIEVFDEEVRAGGGKFLVVHLPQRHDLRMFSLSQELVYQALLDEIDVRYEVVHPEERMIQVASRSSIEDLFHRAHYGILDNRAVADELSAHILNGHDPGQRGE